VGVGVEEGVWLGDGLGDGGEKVGVPVGEIEGDVGNNQDGVSVFTGTVGVVGVKVTINSVPAMKSSPFLRSTPGGISQSSFESTAFARSIKACQMVEGIPAPML